MTLSVRRATADDVVLLWEWRNDPVVRQNSFNSDPIPWAEHQMWFAGRVASPGTRIYLLEDDGRPVAQIRYERLEGSIAQVGGLSVVAHERGKSYGKKILLETVAMVCTELSVRRIFAVVKANNLSSERAFKSSGFILQDQVAQQGYACHQFVYVCLEPAQSLAKNV